MQLRRTCRMLFNFVKAICHVRLPNGMALSPSRLTESRKIQSRNACGGLTYRAEKPLFLDSLCIPDEINPSVVIEAKITSDDRTARDKVARIKELETQRNGHGTNDWPNYEVVACIDGPGFRQRREDMRQLLLRLQGKCSPWPRWISCLPIPASRI